MPKAKKQRVAYASKIITLRIKGVTATYDARLYINAGKALDVLVQKARRSKSLRTYIVGKAIECELKPYP